MKPHWIFRTRAIGVGLGTELGTKFERVSGHQVTIVFEPQGTMQKRMAERERGIFLFSRRKRSMIW